MNTLNIIQQQIGESIRTKGLILSDTKLTSSIEEVAQIVTEAYKKGKKTLIAGNGGSAADAQHIAGELVNRFYFDRPGLPSIALSTNTSVVTAIGNDCGFAQLFARQVQAQGAEGDVFIGISTSGNSENVVNALMACKEKKISTIGLTGADESKMSELCDICIKVPSSETPRVQEAHILIGHIICCIVEEEIFGHLKPQK